MIIISNNGCWEEVTEKNQPTAFKRSFSQNFGVKTDIRDYRGELVISNDMADENCISVKYFFEIYNEHYNNLPLALSIKSAGLHYKLQQLLDQYNITNYFVVDMSIQDSLEYLKCKIKIFTRQSEYETNPSFYDNAVGIWLDEFQSHWITKETIEKYSRNNKRICIASPDLQGREHLKEWAHYKEIEKELGIDNLILCTNYPEKAREFFGN